MLHAPPRFALPVLVVVGLAGCTTARAPLATVEPDYAYTRTPGVEADLSRFYPLPHAPAGDPTTAQAAPGQGISFD